MVWYGVVRELFFGCGPVTVLVCETGTVLCMRDGGRSLDAWILWMRVVQSFTTHLELRAAGGPRMGETVTVTVTVTKGDYQTMTTANP